MKNFRENAISWIVIALYLLCGVGIFYAGYLTGVSRGKHLHQNTSMAVTVDSDKHVAPAPVKTIPQGYVKVPVVTKLPEPNEPAIPHNGIIIFNPKEIEHITDTANHDSASALVPIVQKEYRDSDYVAWVSGYRAKLDSIQVYRKTITVTKAQTVTKRNPFSLGIIGGVGYGVITRKPDIFVGVGGSIRIW